VGVSLYQEKRNIEKHRSNFNLYYFLKTCVVKHSLDMVVTT